MVSDLTGSFAPGSLTAVAGPNGAGKSTLLHALCGLLPVASGRIDRGGLDARAIALLPQEGRLDRSFPISCRDVVALGWTARLGLFRRIGREQYAVADRALASVGLDGLGARPIGALSAGQFQRVLFARTIVRDAPVILLDEPFSAIDATTEADLMAIVRMWHRQGRTIVAVLHDLDLIRAEFPETLLLGAGAYAWGATEDVLTISAIRQAHLRASVPPLAAAAPGEAPRGSPMWMSAGAPRETLGATAMEPSGMEPSGKSAVAMSGEQPVTVSEVSSVDTPAAAAGETPMETPAKASLDIPVEKAA